MKNKLSNLAGVYIIRNNKDTRVYIGSALNINYRRNVHICQLKKGNHHSRHLQRFFHKYGLNSLKFEIVEIIEDTSVLIEREQHYINVYNSVSPNGFNIRPIANTNFGVIHSPESIEKRRQTFLKKGGFYKHTEEDKKRISNSMKQLVKTPEHIANVSKAKKASNYRPSIESRRKMSLRKIGRIPSESEVLKRSKTFSIVDPSGNIITGINFRKYCRDNHLSYSSMYRLLTGQIKIHKGYTL